MRRVIPAVSLVVLSLVVAGCGSSGGGGQATAAGSGSGSVNRSGTARLRIITTHRATLAIASVRVNGHGPFPFIVDTGAARSVISSSIARGVGLSASGAKRPVTGVGCTTSAASARVKHWKVGGVRLPADRVTVMKLAMGGGGAQSVDGLIGSDVLSRFGIAAIDYQQAKLRLGAAAVQLSTPDASSVAIRVIRSHGAVLALTPVHVDGHGPYPFIVDSGAASSVLATSVATKLKLPTVSSSGGTATGVSCNVHTSRVKLKHWKTGSVTLPGKQIQTISMKSSSGGLGASGLLGSGTLHRFGTIAIDYGHQRLLIAPRLKVPAGGSTRLLVEHAHNSTVAVVRVKIGGRGPYSFALDTGATTSVVSSSLAKHLGLKSSGKSTSIAGVIGAGSAKLDRVDSWSAGSVKLPSDNVAVVKMAGGQAGAGIQGLLGSDVLRHFATITIDYRHGRLQLGKAASTPSGATAVPLEQVAASGAAELLVGVSIAGHGPFGFTLDTGASRSVISSQLATALSLPRTGKTAGVAGVISVSRAPVVSVSSWSAGSVKLPKTAAVSIRLRNAGGGIQGLLGSDVLSRFGTVSIDYRSDELELP